jgi:hypothetical protein
MRQEMGVIKHYECCSQSGRCRLVENGLASRLRVWLDVAFAPQVANQSLLHTDGKKGMLREYLARITV